ncbi:hypothetical protein [Zwartia vadi]|nr:hypothetical protein [Zwartia vadi]MDN3988161.1 hypothetical protein [Zwartia vadi]
MDKTKESPELCSDNITAQTTLLLNKQMCGTRSAQNTLIGHTL